MNKQNLDPYQAEVQRLGRDRQDIIHNLQTKYTIRSASLSDPQPKTNLTLKYEEREFDNLSPIEPVSVDADDEDDEDGEDSSKWPESDAENSQEDLDGIEDSPQTSENQSTSEIMSEAEEDQTNQQTKAKSAFVVNLMRNLYKKSPNKEKFLCSKCYNNEKTRKGSASDDKHWFPIKTLQRHLMKAHVFEFKGHEKEFLKYIDFFGAIDKNNDNYENIVNQFKFSYSDLRDLSRVYYSVRDYNKLRKRQILDKMNRQLNNLLENRKGLRYLNANANKPAKNSTVSDKKPMQIGIKKENVAKKEREERRRETHNDRSDQNFGSNKRVGVEINEEDVISKKVVKEEDVLRRFYQLSCEKQDKEKEYEREVARLKKENERLRREADNLEKSLSKYTN